MTMDQLQPKQSAFIKAVGGDGALRHHLLDMGLTPGTEVTLQKIAPMGDPVQMELRGYELTLRRDEARKIEIENIHQKQEKQQEKKESVKTGDETPVLLFVVTGSVAILFLLYRTARRKKYN